MPIVEAAGVASNGGPRGKIIENAMVYALKQAQARGVTDPEQLRAVMLSARAEAKATLAAVEKTALTKAHKPQPPIKEAVVKG